ncbi:MAG TPA: class I SAM-dependent methyltransferase [Candidatus Limnocylindrales bacterium]|nr:class I SAM-dependent methyltransferase [Candidatus Limnocylindrales bacterium]
MSTPRPGPTLMDAGYAAAHAEGDLRHWWFLGRRAVILAEMARWLPPASRRLVEIGCGSGGFLPDLARFGRVTGIEADPFLRAAATARGLDVVAGALPDALPAAARGLDAVCLFDVLEHVEEDGRALAAVRDRLAPGGLLFATVPAYSWMWSRHDELLGHRRRYTAARLRADLGRAGFVVERLTYFNTVLALPIMAVRVVGRLVRRGSHDLGSLPGPLNRMLAACFAFERHLLARAALPFGISVLAVARRPS